MEDIMYASFDETSHVKALCSLKNDEFYFKVNTKEIDCKYISAYKLVEDVIIFDEEKFTKIKEKDNLLNEKSELELWLKEHDYIGTKIATGRATIEEYAEEIELMKQKSARINEINKKMQEI